MDFVYPKREKFFSNRYCRLLWKACAANVLGPETCWLLCGIVMTEDARGYRSPVTYFNEQLCIVAGFPNVKSMVRAREKAIATGWLAYKPGGKGIPGLYFVTIPDENKTWDDAPTDENVYLPDTRSNLTKETGCKREGSGVRTGKEVGKEPGKNREGSGNHSSLYLSLTLPQEEIHADTSADPPRRNRKPADGGPDFEKFWQAYPRHEKRSDTVKAFLKLSPNEELLKTILAAIDRQKIDGCLVPAFSKDGRSVIPHPATWLNGRRWEDERPQAVAIQQIENQTRHDSPITAEMKRIIEASSKQFAPQPNGVPL